jgi:hypothetical protein
VEVDVMAPNPRSFDQKDLSIESRNHIGGNVVPTHGISPSKERPLEQEEQRWMENEGGHHG